MTRKHAARIAVIAALLMLAAAGCGRRTRSDVVAKVDGRPITRDQLFDVMDQEDNGDAGRRALDALIVRQLVREEAEKRGIKADPKDVQRRIEGMKDYVLAGTGKTFEQWLADSGQTEQDIANRVGMSVITAKLVLTDSDREKYFEANKDRLKDIPHNNESVIYRQIVVTTKGEAEAVRKELETASAGKPVTDEQFAKVAEARSLDPMTRGRGGMRGWWVKGKGDQMGMGAASGDLEKVLFALKAGEISQPVLLKAAPPPAAKGQALPPQPEQWCIVMVDKHISPHQITLAGNEDVIEEWMLSDPRFEAQLQQFFENLRARAKVDVLVPRYRAVGEAYQQRRQLRDQMQTQPPPVMVPEAPAGAPQQLPPGQPGRSPGGGR